MDPLANFNFGEKSHKQEKVKKNADAWMTCTLKDKIHIEGRQAVPEGDDDFIPDIPIIQDSSCLQDEGTEKELATAPYYHDPQLKLATYTELQKELSNLTCCSLAGEADLKLLRERGLIYSKEELEEEDVTWDWERLFNDLSSELATESDATEAETELNGENQLHYI